jgi:uncharacterized protein YecT (DUF1311 family)
MRRFSSTDSQLNGEKMAKPGGTTTTLLLVTLLVSLSHPARADTEDPIDSTLDTCLATDQGQTNAGMIACTSTAIKAWNARLNQIYQKDMAALDPKSRDLLRASERQWVAFRSAEHAAQAAPWRADRGTDIDVEILGDELGAIKERAAELKTYLPSD